MKSAWVFIAASSMFIGFAISDLTNSDYVNKVEIKERVDTLFQVDTVKVPPIIINKIQWRTQLPQDKDEPTVYKYLFKEDSVKFVVLIESEIEPMEVTVKDFFVQPKPIIITDTTYVKEITIVEESKTDYLLCGLSFLGGALLSALLFK